jgi:hypothetical protein
MRRSTPPCACLILTAAVLLPSGGSADAQDVPAGRYECYYFTTAQPGLNFTINGGGRYTDVEGKSGRYSVSGGKISFSGGAHDGSPATYKGGNPPTVAFVSPRGAEAATCQLAR